MQNKNAVRFVIGVLCLIAVMSIVGLFVQVANTKTRKGGSATVYQDGKQVAVLPLEKDQTLVITHPDGGSNTITVQNGCVQVTEATCADHICMKTGAVRAIGLPIICLPNHLIIEVSSQKADEKEEWDAIAY